jgi:hypothetical protein
MSVKSLRRAELEEVRARSGRGSEASERGRLAHSIWVEVMGLVGGLDAEK